MRNPRRIVFTVAGLALLSACSEQPVSPSIVPDVYRDGPLAVQVNGAAMTTVDETALGCINGTGTINCNLYTAKSKVYLSGGPISASFGYAGVGGRFVFAVLVPGFQNPGVEGDGSAGNLSDLVASIDQKNSNALNAGLGDLRACRVFDIDADGDIDNSPGGACAHAYGTHAGDGKDILQVAPFDNTTNNGGGYILSVCHLDQAGNPDACKYDYFKIREGDVECPDCEEQSNPDLSGAKYYDSNTNGQRDGGEPGIQGWKIDVGGAATTTLTTDINGDFIYSPVPGTYTFTEQLAFGGPIGGGPASWYWAQTGNTVDQSTDILNTTTLANKAYSVIAVFDGVTTDLNFGNVCYVRPGGRTMGFNSNKNGLALITAPEFVQLTAYNLRNLDGSNRDFVASLAQNKTAYSNWLLASNASNMASMLSAQMSATYLDVQHGFTDGSIVVDGAMTVNQLIVYANGLLANPIVGGTFDGQNGAVTVAASALRTEQERVKNIFDKINNNGALGDFLLSWTAAQTQCFPLDFTP
jgi:hypothetical protein